MNALPIKDFVLKQKLDEIILTNLENEHFGVKELAREAGMSRFSLNRRLHVLCQKTLIQYIREVRLQRALEILLKEPVTASEVSYMVGFSSPAYFSTCFSEYYGYPPGEARKRALFSEGQSPEGSSSEPVFEKQDQATYNTNSIKSKKQVLTVVLLISALTLLLAGSIYLYNLIKDNQFKNQKRSIAVLPFINDSKDADNEYFINGVMEAILDNLSKIKDLDVRPRTSVEQYRIDLSKTVPQIADALGVNYIIEGSGQKIGNEVSLYIQLIEADSDKHIFSQRYNMKLDDIFSLQSEVAMKVASEVKAVITFEEEALIKQTPTTNFAAFNLFLQANDLHRIAESKGEWELDIKAENLYRKAIQLDSTYSDPYSSLGWLIFNRDIDSAFFLANRALHFDGKNPEAYTLKGYVYYYNGLENEAEEAYLQSIKYKPNNSSAFRLLGDLFFFQGNCYLAIENQLKALHLENNSMQQRNNLKSLSEILYSLGLYEEGKEYAAKLLELDNDSSFYYRGLTSVDLDLGSFDPALNSALRMYNCDPENLDNIYYLFHTYLYLKDFREAGVLMQKYMRIMQEQGKKLEPDYLFGFTYYENGQLEEANYHFNQVIAEMQNFIEMDRPYLTCWAYMALAKIYAVRNEQIKAIACLHKVQENINYTILRPKDFKYCTMFDNIRNEPGFGEYLEKAETRYKTEHKKVETLLLNQSQMANSIF
jgi:TolB-like protein/AraC-like DNA-binding protein